MSQDRPPAVDVGDPPGLFALLRRELRPTPGRAGNTLRLALFGLVTVTIGEMFRLPDILLFAYVGFILFSTDAGSTTLSSLVGAGAVVASTVLIILMFMVSLSQPALRLPLMALLTFVTGFLTKGAKLGHALQILGMWTVYNLPAGDQLVQGALEQTYVSGNTTSNTLPNILFMSPEESLVHTVLWNTFELVLAVVLLTLYNKVLGRDPAQVLRSDLADRLDAAARVCQGCADAAPGLAKLARQSTAKPLKLQGAAKVWHPGSPRHEDAQTLISEVDRLCLLLLAWHRVATEPPGATLAHAARTCRAAALSLRANAAFREEPAAAPQGSPGAAPPAVLPLAAELEDVLSHIRRILSDTPDGARNKPGPDRSAHKPGARPGGDKPSKKPAGKSGDKPGGGVFVADAWTNPGYVRFGLKLTLCAAISYGVERLTDWSGISTCLITVFVVSFESTGETVHKALLRIAGCLIGAALGIGTILLLMPHITTLGQFLLVMAGPLSLAAWIKTGSERTNYAGQQIAIAYFACMLSGYGPTLDMEGARDRIAGILLGDVTVYVVFTTIWPVSIAGAVRRNLGQALERLADLIAPAQPDAHGPPPDREKLRQGFDKAISGTQASLVNDRYETTRMRPDRLGPDRGRRLIDARSVASVQALVLPVSMIVALRQPSAAGAATPPSAAGAATPPSAAGAATPPSAAGAATPPSAAGAATPPDDAGVATPKAAQDVATPDAAQDTTGEYQGAMADWFRGCARWMREGTGGAALLSALPRPPDPSRIRSGGEAAPGLAARAAWCGLLHDDAVRMIAELGAEPGADGARARPQALEPAVAGR